MSDLIDRQAAIDALCSQLSDWNYDYNVPVKDCIDLLKNLPSARPERKTGRWIPVANGRGGHECALCHEYAPSYQSGKENLTYFCPNCGADMRTPTQVQLDEADDVMMGGNDETD